MSHDQEKPHHYIDIKPEMVDFVRGEIKITGKSVSSVLRGNSQARKIGLTSSVFHQFLRKKTVNKIRKDHWKLTQTLWENLPNKDPIELRWTAKRAKELRAKVQATRKTPVRFIEGQEDIPEGFSKEWFLSLLEDYRGKVPKSYIDYLYELIKKEVQILKRWQKEEKGLQWTAKRARQLYSKVQATQKTPTKLLEGLEDVPEGFDEEWFLSLLGGYRGRVPKAHIDYLYDLCKLEIQSLIDHQKPRKDIPDQKRKEILSEISRTGMSVSRLLTANGCKEINSQTIMRIANGQQRKCNPNDINTVLEFYSQIPSQQVNEPIQIKTVNSSYEPINKDELERLKRIYELTGLLPSKIFKLVNDHPPYLNPSIISNWLHKGNQADPNDVRWVLESCKKVLKQALGEE